MHLRAWRLFPMLLGFFAGGLILSGVAFGTGRLGDGVGGASQSVLSGVVFATMGVAVLGVAIWRAWWNHQVPRGSDLEAQLDGPP